MPEVVSRVTHSNGGCQSDCSLGGRPGLVGRLVGRQPSCSPLVARGPSSCSWLVGRLLRDIPLAPGWLVSC